jgi:DinB family protein
MTKVTWRHLTTGWVDEAFDGPAWHGPALAPALRGVTAQQAVWRPAPGRHNIAEIVTHAAYWKHVVRRRVGGARDRFPLRGRNWFARETVADWRDAVRLLVDEHRKLRATIAALPRTRLGRRVKAGQTAADNVRGIAAHDVYHAGQIRLLRALSRRGA